ncbi:MAG: hypothetical protein R3C60_13230 [Parvularculaceae bacterium]
MTKDVRKEQLKLLKFERKLAGLAAFFATTGVAAASAADKLNAEATLKAYQDIEAALLNLADVTTHAHAAMEASVVQASANMLQAAGGGPKASASEAVRSVLGLG